MDEIDLQRVGGFQCFVLLAQRPLDVDGVGDVEERDESGAVGQRHRDQVGDAAVAQLQPAFDDVAAFDRRHRAVQGSPQRIVVVKVLAPADHRLDVWAHGQRQRLEPPHVDEGWIVQHLR